MNCIIIDDEPLAINVIVSYCEGIDDLCVLETFTNPLDATELLQSNTVDLIFLDIEMPQITGIEFIKTIDKKPFFIFTTAYPEFAIEGFELNAIDYLVKPIRFSRFIKSVNRAREFFKLKKDPSLAARSKASEPKENQQYIFVKSDYGNIKIKLEHITYIQGLKDYLKIHLDGERPILTLMNFKDMASKLSNTNFVRVHRSYIINIEKIHSVQRNKVLLQDVRIPIGESYKTDFFSRIGLG